MPKIVAIIPSRFTSKRFPGKPLAMLGGLPIIVRVVNQARKARLLDEVMVATDDNRIAEAVIAHGGRAVLADGDFACGSERVAFAAKNLEADIVVNIQGDEPLIAPEVIDKVASCLIENPVDVMSSAVAPFDNPTDADNPNNVKAVLAKDGRALYFSRSRIPYWAAFDKGINQRSDTPLYRHIGIYGFTREFLQTFAALGRSPLEIAENLEQLRALENGYAIRCVVVKQEFSSIDSLEDLKTAERRLSVKR